MCLQMMTTHVFPMVTLKTNAFKLQGKKTLSKKRKQGIDAKLKERMLFIHVGEKIASTADGMK